MTKYPTYKDSGIEWLGQIPTHWELLKAKYMFQKNKREVQDGDKVITCFRDGQVTLRENRRTTGFTESITEIGYQGIRKGDLVIHQMDAFAGAIGVSDADGKGTSVYHCCTPKGEYLTYYYAHVIREMALKGYIQSLYRGIRERSSDFNYVTFGNCLLPVPTPSEQRQIVAYLDYKSNKINERICQRERELQTLSELKQADIAAVVTRGLDPNVPMKESGIEWIGQIPAHWEVTQLRKYLRLFSDKGHPDMDLLSVTREQGVIVRDITSKEENHNFIPDDLSGYKLIQKGQFAINKMKAWQGSYGVSKYKGIVSPAYYTCELNNIDTEYFDVAIRSQAYIGFFTKYSKGIRSGQWDLSPDALKSIPFVEPPIVEQRAIVSYITEISEKIDSYITKLKEEINYLQEYKQRLISDVVTGKVDVRGVEIPNEE
ncbi:restriction endonuclease subunit S [uncultured Alistipes sp.]|uniref:restriction endonuclease subunit S n=1 Tax=uncultured Alistipes sp. TaxID=538949 RepID=UPI0025E6601D|nr:restriction endonuclease subunit S [uncultured Alistipes sp.]